MFQDNTIERRVMETVKTRIALKQNAYNDGCEQIDVEAQEKKATLADTLVAEILG